MRPGIANRPILCREVFLVAAGLWLLYGASINGLNLQVYALHPIVVTALVEDGTFVLGHDEVPKVSDQFLFNGNVLPAKQPGIFVLGAIVYEGCRRLGLTYRDHYLLTEAVVTWLSASLLAAMAGACWFALASRIWGFSRRHALFGTLASGFATILLPYAGIPHHDIVAAAFLVMALLALEVARAGEADSTMESARRRPAAAFTAGVLLAASLSCSMLPVVVVLGLLCIVAATRRLNLILPVGVGFALGLIPLALYNAHYFHTPWIQANLAGEYSDTYPGFDVDRIMHHLNVYLGLGDVSVVKYMPIVLLGIAGLPFFATDRARPRGLMATLLLLHLLYLLAIPAYGYCQYGPRFLIPAVPLAMFGLPALFERVEGIRSGSVRRFSKGLIWSVAIYSLMVNIAGTLGGTMYCQTERFAFPKYLAVLSNPSTWSEAIVLQFPLFWPCAVLGALWVAAAGYCLATSSPWPRKAGTSSRSSRLVP